MRLSAATRMALLLAAPASFALGQQAKNWSPSKTYSDPSRGITFSYPMHWKPTTASVSMFGPQLIDTREISPAVAFYDQPSSGPYANSNLRALYFTYAYQPTADTAACDHLAATVAEEDEDKPSQATINHIPFAVREIDQAGLGSSEQGHLYSTYRSGTCLLFETTTAMVAPGLTEGRHNLTAREWAAVDAHLRAIMHTVRIKPSSPLHSPPLTTYRDPKTGVAFDYPAAWARVHPTQADPSFDYCQPAVFGSAKDTVPVRFAAQFSGDRIYTDTNLSSLVFLYGIKPNVSVAACHDIASGISEQQPEAITIQGVSFTQGTGGECGLSHSVDAKVYTAFRHNTCYVFEEDFYTANYTERARDLTQPEIRTLQRHLDAIMQTVRFDPPPR